MALASSTVRAEAPPIESLLDVYRRRIWHERRVRYLTFAALGVGVVWFLTALLFYADAAPSWSLPVCIMVALILPAMAVAYEEYRKPSAVQTATIVDSLFDNQQRMLTSLELVRLRSDGIMPQAQLASTTGLLSRVDPRLAYPARTPWAGISISAGLIFWHLRCLF